jgi:hypothetical protein
LQTWESSPSYQNQSLAFLDKLAARYGSSPALVAIGILNKPTVRPLPLSAVVFAQSVGNQLASPHTCAGLLAAGSRRSPSHDKVPVVTLAVSKQAAAAL